MDPTIETIMRVSQGLADPHRIRIVMHLLEHESAHVGELVAMLGCDQPKTSFHLKRLRQLKLASGERKGRQIFYRLTDEVKVLMRQMATHHQDMQLLMAMIE
ncbi:MAG: winged helix-turn-helix transcriptional regulator [Bdellovibrionales bacterium]|nr:winged helix-turn-helix transcriptional regulator [Bdellovibrionales bacterium]